MTANAERAGSGSSTSKALTRPARSSDAESIAELLAQLGYPTSPAEIPARLERIDAFEDAQVLVAELDGVVVGVVTSHLLPTLHGSGPAALLTALVVAPTARRLGIGALLVSATEEWARANGAAKILVTSALHRADAHAFYEALGWSRTGVRLAKMLG
jgi:GNAT superfamily N-acetyltransferase